VKSPANKAEHLALIVLAWLVVLAVIGLASRG
jgi:hypothetical protein